MRGDRIHAAAKGVRRRQQGGGCRRCGSSGVSAKPPLLPAQGEAQVGLQVLDLLAADPVEVPDVQLQLAAAMPPNPPPRGTPAGAGPCRSSGPGQPFSLFAPFANQNVIFVLYESNRAAHNAPFPPGPNPSTAPTRRQTMKPHDTASPTTTVTSTSTFPGDARWMEAHWMPLGQPQLQGCRPTKRPDAGQRPGRRPHRQPWQKGVRRPVRPWRCGLGHGRTEITQAASRQIGTLDQRPPSSTATAVLEPAEQITELMPAGLDDVLDRLRLRVRRHRVEDGTGLLGVPRGWAPRHA